MDNVRFCAEPISCEKAPYFYSLGWNLAYHDKPISDCHKLSQDVDNQLDAELGWIDYMATR